MTTTLQFTAKETGASAAGQVLAPVINVGLGAPASMAATTYSANSIFGGDSSVATTAYSGHRRELAAAIDLSDKQYIQFQMAHSNLSRINTSDWAANGMLVVFEDTAGNWAAFRVFGGDVAWNPSAGGGTDGYFGGGTGFNGPISAFVHIELTRTPDYQSASAINWAAVDAYEVHHRPSASGRMQSVIGYIRTINPSISSGTVSDLFSQIRSAWALTIGGGVPGHPFRAIPQYAQGFANLVWCAQIGFQVGDGSTATTGTIEDFGVAFWNPPEDTHDGNPAYPGVGAFQLLDTPRLADFYLSASDALTINDGVWSSSSQWGVRVRGSASGSIAFNRNTFYRTAQFECAHGQFTDCAWDGHTAAIDVTAATGMVRGTVRNGVGHGIKISGAGGNYAGLGIAFDDNTTYDVELGSGGAGTYVLTGVSVLDGAYTLKIRNDSATNAVVVELPSGILYSTSTAGGSITVTTPAIYQSVTVNGLVVGSRVQIYDTSSSTELHNAVPAGASVTWTDSVAATASRAIRVRIAYVSGVAAKEFLEANIGTCGTGTGDSAITYLANQVDDAVYNTNAINGSTVTGITIDDSADRVYINIGGGSVTWPSIYAYQCHWNQTEAGIRDDGAIIEAVDPANYTVYGFLVKNTSTTRLKISGGYAVDETGNAEGWADDTGGSIFPVLPHVVAYATGSGLSAGEQAQLAQAANAGNLVFTAGNVNANVKANNDTGIKGDGTSGDKWRSVLVP